MTVRKQSSAGPTSASTLLPTAAVIQHPTAKRAVQQGGAFTKASIAKMRCGAGQRESFFWDRASRGLGLRALSSGKRSWVYQYRDEHRRTRRIVLGDVSVVSLEVARASARQHAAAVTQGANPSVQRKSQRAAPTVLEMVEAYLRYAKTRQRPRSYAETRRHLRQHAAGLHHNRAESVGRRDVSAILERVAASSGPAAANRTRAALSAMWSWGLRLGLIEMDSNPVAFTIRQVEKSRDRTLTDAELKAIWAGTSGNGDYDRIVRLLLLTGCRREEIGGVRWEEISDERLLIDEGRMKGGITHEIPLLPALSSLLPDRPDDAAGCAFGRRGTGFSGWSKAKRALDAKIAEAGATIAPWTLHDLRRTFSTRLHDAGVEPIVVEALLAHKQQGVAGVYNRASFREAKRTALARWHEILSGVLR
jgi:integrase